MASHESGSCFNSSAALLSPSVINDPVALNNSAILLASFSCYAAYPSISANIIALQTSHYSPLAHASPPHQQAAAPTSSHTAPPSPSPASSPHRFPESPASSGTPRTASHPCASQSGRSSCLHLSCRQRPATLQNLLAPSPSLHVSCFLRCSATVATQAG